MATQKRRVIYMADQEWSAATARANEFGISISEYLRRLVIWRQPEAESARDPYREFRPVPKPGKGK